MLILIGQKIKIKWIKWSEHIVYKTDKKGLEGTTTCTSPKIESKNIHLPFNKNKRSNSDKIGIEDLQLAWKPFLSVIFCALPKGLLSRDLLKHEKKIIKTLLVIP